MTRSICSFEPHLVIHEMTLLPGGEWQPNPVEWLFISVVSGSAYWMSPRQHHQLAAGTVLVVSKVAQGVIRSSQLDATRLVFFRADADALAGLATLAEERFLRRTATQDAISVRIFEPGDAISEEFREVRGQNRGNDLVQRFQLLGMFIDSLGIEVWPSSVEEDAPPASAKGRLQELLKQIPAGELINMDFAGLAKQMCCTPRHLSRTFHEVMGVSFRQKQVELRLSRAKELLATTRTKVLEVAQESGYQSLSLFNLVFKRHFGVTPTRWREQVGKRRASPTPAPRNRETLVAV